MQLKAKNPDQRLIPSLEVEIVWYSRGLFGPRANFPGHVLRPKFYEAFCLQKFGEIITHDFADWLEGHENPAALQETAELYEQVHHFATED